MSLSDKAVKDLDCHNPIPNYYWEKNVREAVKALKEYLKGMGSDPREALYGVDKIFGEKLIE